MAKKLPLNPAAPSAGPSINPVTNKPTLAQPMPLQTKIATARGNQTQRAKMDILGDISRRAPVTAAPVKPRPPVAAKPPTVARPVVPKPVAPVAPTPARTPPPYLRGQSGGAQAVAARNTVKPPSQPLNYLRGQSGGAQTGAKIVAKRMAKPAATPAAPSAVVTPSPAAKKPTYLRRSSR